MAYIFTLALGFVIWYFYFGLECWINGAASSGYGNLIPFKCLWDDIKFNSPGGWKRRLEFTAGDEEWASQIPGIDRFIFNHILIPLLPTLVLLTWNILHQ